jgi:hypothetical protein
MGLSPLTGCPVKAPATALRDPASLHPLVRELGLRYLDHVARLDVEIAELDKGLRRPFFMVGSWLVGRAA